MTAPPPGGRRVVRIDDLRPPAERRRHPQRGRLALRWFVGLLVVVVLIVLLARSIPAAPHPTLGPPSTPRHSAALTRR